MIDLADAWFSDRGKGWSLSTSRPSPATRRWRPRPRTAGLLRILDSPAMVCDGAARPGVVARRDHAPRSIDDAAGVADLVAICDAAYQSLGHAGRA